jgi:hypothetical protein
MVTPASEQVVVSPAWPRARVAAVAVALAAGAALVRGLARPGRPMWLDEAVTLAMFRFDPGGLVAPSEVSGATHRLLLRAVFAITDPLGFDPLTAARGLSGLLGVAAVPAFYLLARRLFGERVGLLAGLLLVVNQFHAYYSIEARAYALAFLVVVLSTSALVELLETPRTRTALVFGLLAGLATWVHLFGALVLAAQALASLFHPNLRAVRGRLFGALALGAAVSVMAIVRGMQSDGGQVSWIEPLSFKQVEVLFLRLSGTVRLLQLPVLGGLAVALAGAWRGGRDRFPMALAAALLLVPVLLAVLVSTVKPLLVPRYLLVALPGFLLLAALGMAALRRRELVVAAALLFAGRGLYQVARDPKSDPLWQPIDRGAARLLEVVRPGDGLVVSPPVLSLSLDRELGKLGRGAGPARVSPAVGDPFDLQGGTEEALVERARGHAGVIFLLAGEQPKSARLRAALEAGGTVTSDDSFDTVRLLRVERR